METYFGGPGNPASPPPGYVEGYPRFAFIDLRAAVREGRPLCVFLHPNGANRGHAYAEMRNGSVDLTYFIKPFYGESSHSSAFAIELQVAALGQGRSRTMMVCPRCRKRAGELIFFRGWACRKCLGLYYRSLTTTRLARMRTREAALAIEIANDPVPWQA